MLVKSALAGAALGTRQHCVLAGQGGRSLRNPVKHKHVVGILGHMARHTASTAVLPGLGTPAGAASCRPPAALLTAERVTPG